MINAFTALYTAFGSFFARSFWFSVFLPVAVFLSLHAVIAAHVLGPVQIFGLRLSEAEFSAPDLAVAAAAITVMYLVLAYALMPFVPRFRGYLDGTQLPEPVHDWLHRLRLHAALRARIRRDALMNDTAEVGEHKEALKDPGGSFRTAYQASIGLQAANWPDAIAEASTTMAALERAIFRSDPLLPAVVAAERAIAAALRTNGVHVVNAGVEERQRAAELRRLADSFATLVGGAAAEAVYRMQVFDDRYRLAGALASPRATRVGDARLVAERYARDAYRVDFNFLWPRLLAAMKVEKKDDLLDLIDAARSRVDFAALSLALAASVSLVWLPMILIERGPAWLFLLLGAATPVTIGFFYELVFEGQLAWSEVVKTTIDQSRFLVLRSFRQPDPRSRHEEWQSWSLIERALEDGRLANMIYEPAAKP